MKKSVTARFILILCLFLVASNNAQAQTENSLNFSMPEAISVLQKAQGGSDLLLAEGDTSWEELTSQGSYLGSEDEGYFGETSNSFRNNDASNEFFSNTETTNFNNCSSYSALCNIPEAIVLSAPENNAKGLTRQPTFTWVADDLAISYVIELATISNFSSILHTITGITTNEYTLTEAQALDYHGGYYWRVTGVGADGAGPLSEERYFTVKPGPVTLDSPSDEATNVLVKPEFVWNQLNSVYKYDIEISTNSEFSTTVVQERVEIANTKSVGSIALNPTGSFTPSSPLEYNTTYYWRVRGEDNANTLGDWSDVRSFETKVARVTRVAPTNNAMNQSVTPEFIWQTLENVHLYKLTVSTNSDMSSPVIDETVNTSPLKSVSDISSDHTASYTPTTPLSYSTEYYWNVVGYNSSNELGVSAEESMFTTVPLPPDKVTLSAPGDDQHNIAIRPTFTWIHAIRTVTYSFQLATDINFNNIVHDEDISVLAKSIGNVSNGFEPSFTPEEDLDNDTQYYWRVRGENAGGNGVWSDTWSFRTIWPVPAQVTVLTPTDGASGQSIRPVLTWEDGEYVNWYYLEIYTTSDLSGTPVYTKDEIFSPSADAKSVGGDEISNGVATVEFTVDADLDNATVYYWQVRGKNNTGDGTFSVSRSFTTIMQAPNPVTRVAPSDGATNQSIRPTLSWQPSSNALFYDIQIATTMNFAEGDIVYTRENLNFSGKSSGEVAAVELEHDVLEDLGYNTTYYWRMRAKNSDHMDTNWNDEPWSFTTIWPVPGTVTLLTPEVEATAVQVLPTFTWEHISYGSQYELQVWDNNVPTGDPTYEKTDISGVDLKSTGNVISDVSSIGHTITTTLDNNLAYFWRVRAKNSTGTGEWTAFREFTTVWAAPGVVTRLTPSDGATGQSIRPTLSWQPSTNTMYYDVQIATTMDFAEGDIVYSREDLGGFSKTTGEVAAVAFEHEVEEDLGNNTTYYWRVRAKNTDLTGNYNDEPWSFTTIASVPAMVSLLSPNTNEKNISLTPTFRWGEAARAVSYRLHVSTAEDFETTVINVEVEELTYKSTSKLSGHTTYYYRVQGVNTEGVSGPWSAVRPFVTTQDVPAMVHLLSPNNKETGVNLKPTFMWGAVEEAKTYQLQVSLEEKNFATTVLDEEGLTQTNVEIVKGNLLASTSYLYRARAKNAVGYGDWSTPRRFTTKEAEIPGKVTDIQIRQITSKQVVSSTHSIQNTAGFEVSWTPPDFDGGSPITNYRILYRKADETSWTTYEREASADTVATVTGFTPGVGYAFDVLAENAVGASEPNDNPPVAVSIEAQDLPTEITLNQNYPNPFNPATTIRFALPVSGEARLEVYSILGQRMALLVSGQQPAGWHTVQLDATSWSSGTYIYRLQTEGNVLTKKFLLVK